MLSKAAIKYINSLQLKKYRKQEQCFVVEGAKTVQELLASDFEVVRVFGTEKFRRSIGNTSVEFIEVSEDELSAVGEFKTNDSALAIARMRPSTPVSVSKDEFVLALDDIRDPGNLGTIIRTADWYGINKVVASPETADFYSSKTLSSTMGSFTRVGIQYIDLHTFLEGVKVPVYGAYLEGQNVHTTSFAKAGVVLIGNESRGISDSLAKYVTDKITIPRFGSAESLNAGIATAIILDNIRRSR